VIQPDVMIVATGLLLALAWITIRPYRGT